MELLNQVCRSIQQGETFTTDVDYQSICAGYPIRFLKVNDEFYSDYVGHAEWYYQGGLSFPLLELIWPDINHNYPC